ncbi:MAG: chemotaxis protein CheW [Gammaproteobacteria bacterium]|nr:chemotaxis protein CheW [Gammaproteobacteria bacterium]
MAQLDENNALLIYRVGPVLSCAPTRVVETIISPPALTHPPGTSNAHPGIFKHGSKLVHAIDVRVLFGVEEKDWVKPGRIVIAEFEQRHYGFWVDQIIDVIKQPEKGWGQLSAHLSGGVFTRTLTLDSKIHLYAEFEKLQQVKQTGFLRPYIEHLEQEQKQQKIQAESTTATNTKPALKTNSADSLTPKPVQQSIDVSADTQTANNDASTVVTPDKSKTKPATKKAHHTAAPATQARSITTDTADINASVTQDHQTRSASTHQTATASHLKTNEVKTITQQHNSAKTGSGEKNKHHTLLQSEKIKSTSETLTPAHTRKPAGQLGTTERTIHPSQGTHRQEQNASIEGKIREPTFDHSDMSRQSAEFESTVYSSYSEHTSTNQTDTENNNTGLIVFMLALFLVAIAGGGYYFWPEEKKSNQIISQNTNSTTVNNTPAPQPSNINQELTQKEDHTNEVQPYHASIAKKDDELTIVITTPENENALKFNADEVNEKVTDSGLISGEKTQSADTEPATEQFNSGTRSNHENEPYNQTISATLPTTITKEIVHIVVKGDTLWHITERYIHNPFRYPELARLNKIKNPDLIYPGNRVRIIQILTPRAEND